MAKEYVKSGASLVDVSGDKIRNFACLEDVRAAILAGDLVEGDMFSTICQTTGQTEDIAQEVCRIASYIPANTSPTNQLLNHCDVVNIESDIACRVQCCDYDAYTTANDACMACRVQCCDFNDYVTTNDVAVACKVECSDYTTCVTAIDTAISCRVQCCDYNDNVTCVNDRLTAIENVSIPDLDTCICCAEERLTCLEARADVLENITVDPTSGLVSTVSDLSADYHACCTSWNNSISTLNGKPGLDCVGTVVASDIASFITMADVNACGYTTCTGNVTLADISDMATKSWANSQGWTTCTGNVRTSDLDDYATKSWVNNCGFTTCTGTLTSSDLDDYATKTCVRTIVNGIFSLSGNVLTITSA